MPDNFLNTGDTSEETIKSVLTNLIGSDSKQRTKCQVVAGTMDKTKAE